jgi:hypothetical protein
MLKRRSVHCALSVLVMIAVAAVVSSAGAQQSGPRFAQLAQTAAPPVPMIAPAASPPLQEEAIPPPPTPAVYWQPGHWTWVVSTWVWIAGQYVERPQPQAVWQPGH